MSKYFKANAIPQVEVKVGCDEFENVIRKCGVGFACEWFGHDGDGNFAKETVNVLCESSGISNPFSLKNGEYVEIKD
jgi:hypothetical protein